MSIILSFTFTCKLKICIILKATQHLGSFLGCKWGFSVFWWPSIEIYGHMYLPKIIVLLPSKRKPLYYTHCQKTEFAFYSMLGVPSSRVSVFQVDSVCNESPWLNSMAQPSSQTSAGKFARDWYGLSPHLPYLVLIIKTCLLKYTFLLPNMEGTRLLHSLLYSSSELNEHPSNLSRDYRWFL